MNLGELIVELCADTAQLEKSLEQAKKKAYEAASSIEKSFEKINLEINVDDDSLVDLNKHLNLKVQHLKEVNKYFSNNPIVVNVDDDSLVDLNKHLNLKVQHLKEVNKYFNSNPIVVNTDVTKLDELEERLGKLSSKTITITVESDLSKQLEKSLTDAVQSAVRDAVSESSAASSQQQAQKDSASSSKAQRVDVVASPMRSIIDGAFENVGKRLTKGINSSIEDTIGVSMDDMTRMSGNMLLRYFGVGKKAQSDPKNEQKRIEAIFKDGMDAFIRTHDSRVEKGTRGRRATRSAANDDIGVDFESASRIASSSALRYFGVGKKAQSDPKNEQARVKAIIEDAIKEYSGSSIKQSNSGVISSTFSEINKAFSDSINVTIESVAQNAKLATIRQARQSAKAVTQNSAPGVQNAISGFFDAAESSDKGAVNKYIGEGIASQSKKAVESIFNRLLPNASPVIKDFLKTGVSAKPVEPIAKSSSDILKEAASDLKNAAKALSDAAVSVKSTEPTAKTSKPFVAKTTPDPWQDAAPLPKQLPPKANKSPLPPPQQKRELEPIPVNIPEQIKPLFKTIQSEIHKNIDISEGYKNATKLENDLTPLPSIPSSKNTKKSAQVSLDSIEQSLIAINKYFSDEYKRIQAKVKHAVSDAGTKEDISATRSEVSNFVSRSKEAISTIDKYVKTGEDAGFSKDINSELSRIHSSGKSSISKNTRSAEKGFLGKLNLADKKLFDQQLKGYVAQAESLGIEVDAGLKKGIQHAAGGVSDAARAMLDDLIKAVKAKMEIQSPSKVMIALGLMIASGLAIGIKKGVVDVSGASNLLTDVVGDGLKNIKSIPSEGIESYDQAIKNAVSSNSETTKKVFDNAKKASKATIPGMILGTAMMGVADTNLVPKSIRTPLRHLGAFYQGTTQVHKLNPQLAREAEIATIFNMMQSAEKGDGYFPDGGVVGMVKHKTLPTLAHTLGGFNYTQTKDGGLQINDVYDWHQDTDTDKNTPFKLPKNLGSKIYKFLESKKWLRGLLGIEENLFGNTKAFTKYNKKTGRELFSFLNTQSGNDFQLGHSVHSELIGGNPYIQTHRLDRKGLDDLTDLAANPYIASKGNFGQFLNHPKIQEYVLGNGQESQQPTGNNNLLGNLFNNAKSAFSKGGGLKEVGINLISSFGQGFLSANGGVLGIVIGFAKGVLGAVKKVFGIASPSKVMESIGLDFGEGFENGAVAALVLANKRIAELILKTVNQSATATELEKAKAEHFANTVKSQNQRIAKGFREGRYNDLNASEAMETLASSTTFGKVMARITGASMAEIPGILQQARRDVKSSSVTENVVAGVNPTPDIQSLTPASNSRFTQDLELEKQAQARIKAAKEQAQKVLIQGLLSSQANINFGTGFNNENIASNILSSSTLVRVLRAKQLNPEQLNQYNQLVTDFEAQKSLTANRFATASKEGYALTSQEVTGLERGLSTSLARISEFAKTVGMSSQVINRIMTSSQMAVSLGASYQPPRFSAPRASIPERQPGQTDEEYSETVRRALAESNNNRRAARNAYNRMILGIRETVTTPPDGQLPALPPARTPIPDPWNGQTPQIANAVVQQIKKQLALPPASPRLDINSLSNSAQSSLRALARDVISRQPRTQLSTPQPVSPIITPRSFAPNPDARLVLSSSINSNPNAQLVLPNSTTVNPNTRLILPNSTTANPDARLILPSRPSTAARATITQQEVNTQALINKNKDLLVNLNALLNRSMTASLTGFATVLDDLMNAPRSPVVRSLTRQVGARLPVVLPPTVPTSLVPEPFKPTTIRTSLPTGLGFFPIPASPAKPPAVTPSPFAPTSPPPPPIPPAPPSLSSPPPPPADGFLPIRVRTPQNATNQYLQLGKDLVTNLFTAVGDSIRQSTLSGYASLGQVMRNAVNAALFSLADTLKQPLYKGLLSQAQSALPWFMKFIPKTMQLIPMLKPLMPIIGGLTLGLGNSIVKNLLNNDVLKPGGFLTKLLSSVTRIDLTSLSGGKSHGILGAISKIMNPVPNFVGTAGIGGPLSLAMGLFGPFMNTFSGILGLDPSTRSNPKNQAPTVERVLQEQTLANRKKAGLSNAKGGQASRELIENLGNTAVDSVLENLNIPMIPTSVIQGMTGRSINKQSGKIADVISSIGVQRSKTEKALERAMKSGTISPERLDALTKAALRRRGVDTTTREAMSREELEKARQDIIGKPLAISENERNLMFAMGDIERSRFKLGVPRAQRRLDYLTAKVLKERGVTFSDYTSMKQSGKLEETRRDLAANPNTTGVVGRLTQAYAANDQEALKGLLMQGLKKAGMSSEQLQNIDPKLLNTATSGLMATLTGLQAKFKEKGFDMGKALAQGFKDSVRNLANAKDDLEYNAKKAIGQANFGDAVGLIFRRMTRGTIATQDQFKEMYNQMGAGVKKALFSSSKEADAMFPNMLQFMGSIATTLAPVTSLFASLSPLFLPLAPIIGGIGAAVSMVMPHISKMLDGIQRVEVLQRRFTFLGGSKAGGEAEFKYAKDVAAKMNVPSEVAANSYSQLAIAARGSKMEGQGVKDLFEGITASLSALGISGQDASLVFMAYTQILAKGKLSMEELRQQLGEKFPPAMGVFAKSMGVSVPEMNALVASGSVLSQDILPNVAKVLNQDYGASAANQAGGLVVALNKLGNVGFEITTIFTDKLGSTLGWFVGTFADGLALFSNTLGALIPLGQAFAIGFAATIAIGLTTIMTKVKPLVVLFGSLQNLLMATFTAVATNMMPMIIGVTADVADNWLGAEKDLITNMMDGVTNAVVATFSTVDSVMRSMSGGNFSFSSMFGGLVQGAEQAGNIIDWLKGVFSGFFKIIPPGFVELLAMVFMFEQGTGLMVMALAPAFKGFIGAVTGMFGGAAKAFVGVMTSMKIATELMMTSMSSAMAASEARVKIFSATMGFLRTALTHVAVAFGILMFSKGDFSNPMGDSLSKTTKELNNGLTEIRANVQKTADSFDKAINSVTKLGGTLADTLPSKGIQLDIRSFWGGGDFKWDDAIKERNKRDSASGSLMDAVGVGALGAAGAGAAFASGISVLSSILNSAVSTAATIAANKALIAGPVAPVSIFGRLAMAVTPLITAIMSPLGLIVVSIGGFIAAIVLATKALDLFAPKLTGKQKQLIADNKLEGYFDLGENARLTNAQQQILKYFEDQKKNIQNLKEFGASQGFTGKPGDFMADIKPLTGEQQNTFNNTPAISKLNQEIKDNNKRRLAAIADKKNSGASPQEIKDLQNSPGFKELENKSKQMRNVVALAAASFQIENTPENQRIDKELDGKIKKKQAEIDKRRAAVSASRNLMAASSTDAFALSIGEGSDAGTIKLEDELKVLEAQKKNQQKLIKVSVQRAFNFQEIKDVDKQLINATKKGVELSKALPSDKVRKEQGEVKQLIQQLYKRRQELVDSFGSPLPILENQLKKLEKYKEQLTLGEVEGIQGALIPAAVQETQRQIEELKKQIAGVKPFDVKPVEEMLYTQATNAVKDANIKFERASSANRSKSNLSQSKVYSSAGTSQQIAPELANIQLAGLNDSRTLLEEKLKTNQIALDKIAQVIAVGGTNLAEAQSEYDKLTEDIMKDRESLTQNALETAKARRDMKQALIDQTKQVAEYYRTSVREAQGASIEFEKAKKTLEGSQLQNKLRAALIGAGDNIYTQFIEGIINIISQTTDMEKKRLDERKQQYDYQNNVDDIKLRASELQRSLPGKIVPFDENKIKDFDEQLKIVQGSVIGINTDVQQVVTSLGQDAVLATNQLNDAFQGLGTTVAEVGTKLDTTLDKLTSTLDSLKVGTNDLSPQNAPNWAAGALDILGQMDNATPGTAPTIPATTPTIPSAPTIPATNFASPVKNTTIQDLINYKPTFGQSVMGSRPKGRIHNKVDFDSRAKAGAGAEILASLPGVATGKLWKGNDGAVFVNSVLPSGTKVTIEYGHLSIESIKKALGGALEKSVQVQAGQKLGNVLGNHLDFGVKANGRYINPQVFLSNLARGDYGAIANQPPATSKVKSGATVQNANKGESLVRIQRLGEKDEYGLEKLQLAVIKRGKLIDSFIVNSGNPRTQIFGGAGETKAGSKRPFEFGSYTLGKTVPAGNKKKMGNELIRIEPNFETERTAIGFHIDKDRLIDPGSSGCIVFANEAEFNKFKQALKTSGIKNIVFDQAVGAVEVAKVITGKVARSSNNSIPGTSRITQGGNDLSAEEYAKLTPLGKKLYELRRNPNVLALASAVARAEGTDFRKNSENFGYGMLIGGANVKDFSTHPFVGTGRKPTWIPGINNSSTASGRYQMMNFNASIQAAKKQFGKDAMPDMFKLIDFQGKDQPGFSPGLQDLYFIGSLLQRGVLDDVVAGKIDSSVLNKLAPHYASIGLGNKRSAYSGQGTPQGKHDNFLKFYQQNLGKLNQIVMTGGAVNPDKLQGLVTEAANLNLGAAATKNSTNEMNNEAQRLTDEVQQLLGIYRLLRQTEEAGFSVLSGMKDLNLDFVKTIAEGLSPSGLSSLERFNIAYGELVRSLEKKRESLEKTIRDTQGTVDNKPLLKAAFESALQKFPTAELALKAIKANDKVFEIAVLQNQQAKKMLSDYDASIPKILDAFKGKFSFDEQLRLSGIAIQNEKSGVALLQKQIEQRKLLQQLDPLDTKSARTAELEANIALLNADLDLREKLNNISRQEKTKEISPEDAKKQRNLAQQENAITKENIQLKLEAEKITERTNNANKLLERSQFIQDSFKGVLEARSSVLKAYGLDFRAEKIDKQVAITNQQFDFAKASIQLDDFIRKNEKATGANKLTNEQINELRENLRLTNEYKLDAIKLQFSELGSVIKNTTSGFRNGFKEFLLSTKSFGESLADLFNSITKNLIDSLADIASKRMTDSLFGWVAGLFGGKGAGLASGGSFVGDVLPNTSFNMAFAGGMVGELPTFANGGIVGALNKERSLTGRVPHVIIASEGERVLNHKETAIWNKLQGGVAGFANGGVVGAGGNGAIASRMGNTTTINVPVSVAVGSDSEVDTRRLSQAVQAMVSDGIRREMRVGGSINRGNPYGR